jgi:hypothetical protein
VDDSAAFELEKKETRKGVADANAQESRKEKNKRLNNKLRNERKKSKHQGDEESKKGNQE